MSRPKLDVNDVWILNEVMPYEGSTILGVFADVNVGKSRRGRWYVTTDGNWTTRRPGTDSMSMDVFFTLTQHPVLTR